MWSGKCCGARPADPDQDPVVMTLMASGSVADHQDTSALRNTVASIVGVDASLVTITVAAGSVVITVSIAIPKCTSAPCQPSSSSIQNELTTTLKNATAASAMLGITITATPSLQGVTLAEFPPVSGGTWHDTCTGMMALNENGDLRPVGSGHFYFNAQYGPFCESGSGSDIMTEYCLAPHDADADEEYGSRVLTMLKLVGVRLQNGRATSSSRDPTRDGWGGAILAEYARLTLEGVTIQNCHAGVSSEDASVWQSAGGGAVATFESWLSMYGGTEISDCSARHGAHDGDLATGGAVHFGTNAWNYAGDLRFHLGEALIENDPYMNQQLVEAEVTIRNSSAHAGGCVSVGVVRSPWTEQNMGDPQRTSTSSFILRQTNFSGCRAGPREDDVADAVEIINRTKGIFQGGFLGGGAFVVLSGGSHLLMRGCKFYDCQALHMGGTPSPAVPAPSFHASTHRVWIGPAQNHRTDCPRSVQAASPSSLYTTSRPVCLLSQAACSRKAAIYISTIPTSPRTRPATSPRRLSTITMTHTITPSAAP